jgi:hypothetical protein
MFLVFKYQCFIGILSVILYCSCSCIYTVKYKIKLLDESIVEESPEEGATFFVNEGKCITTFIQMMNVIELFSVTFIV